jgi:hypothetical protein
MARDKFHYEVKQALVYDGWSVTDDPLYIKIGTIPVHIDLGAEKIIGAERNGEKIAVEIKTFSRLSFINAFHDAVGQYIVYREALAIIESDRVLYLAMPLDTYEEYGSELLVQKVLENHKIKIIIYESTTQHIVSWLK